MSRVVVISAEDNKLSREDIKYLKQILKSPANKVSLIRVIPKLPAEMFAIPEMASIERKEYSKGMRALQEIVDELGVSVSNTEIVEGKAGANGRAEELEPDVILVNEPARFRDVFGKIRYSLTGRDSIPIMTPEVYAQESQPESISSYREITKKGGRGTHKEEVDMRPSEEKTHEVKPEHKKEPRKKATEEPTLEPEEEEKSYKKMSRK